MPQKRPIIPGGRPRSSSCDDVLDIDEVQDGLCGTLLGNLNDRNCTSTDGPRRSMVRAHMAVHNSASNLNYSDDTVDSDSKLSSGSSSLSGRKGLTLKSMRKAVSRVFVKESKFTDAPVKRHDQANDMLKVWTPDLRHLEEKESNKSNELPVRGTSSVPRSLVTDSHIGMPIPNWKTTPGTVGIYNHGNNCFMNAILQCLSNTDSFTEYFVRDFFKKDLKNGANGKKGVFRSSHGKVTEQLGQFLKSLWSEKYTREVSEEFKAIVAKFNSQYEGDNQHDAQEFFVWLLDRIHEDVSTFTKRKAKPQKVIPKKTDKEMALEAALANGESFILKLFQALHSSTLTCPACGEYSNTFDPYLCLSLPLPQGCQRIVRVIVVFLDSKDSHQVMMAFTLHQYDEVRELRELVASRTKIPAKQLLFVQLEDDRFGMTYHDEQLLSDIPDCDTLYAFEVHPENATRHNSTQEFDSPLAQVLLMHVEITSEPTDSYRFCSPTVLHVRRDIKWKDLHMEILKKMENSLSDDAFASQKLDDLFSLRIYDGSSRKYYLPSDVELPLYTHSVERALSTSHKNSGLAHIKIIAEWDTQTKSRFVVDDREHIETSMSVRKAQNNSLEQGKITLEECFRLYTKEEKLLGDDAWLCPHCKHQQQGTIKVLSLWSLPDVLVLHLKRFKQSGLRRSKLNTLIDFPIDGLDMSAHVSRNNQSHQPKSDDYMYDLMAVSNHYGNMMGGHYTAYCRNPVDGKWREYDDAKVEILEGSVVTKEAYLLFYQRRSLSKIVNQRLFNGDHWVYSLYLSPSEKITENSTKNLGSELTQQVRNSSSRSASPSILRQSNRGKGRHLITTSMTPQPVRRPMMPFVDDKELSDGPGFERSLSQKSSNASRRSRSLQRQSSGSRSRVKREGSMENSVGSIDRFHNNRNSRNIKMRESDLDQVNSFRPKLSNDVARQQTQTSRTTGMDRAPSAAVGKPDSTTSKDVSISTPKHANHDLSQNNKTWNVRTSPPSSTTSDILQEKQDDNTSQSSGSPRDSPSLSHEENPSRKLASKMKQGIINAGDTHATKTDNVNNSVQIDFTKRQTMIKVDSQDNLDGTTASTNKSGHHVHSAAVDTISTDNGFNHHQHTDSLKSEQSGSHSHPTKDIVAGPYVKQRQYVDSEFKQKLNEVILRSQQFHKPLQKHVGGTNGLPAPSNGRHTSRFAGDNGILNSEYESAALLDDVSSQSKYATISHTSKTSQAGRYERNGIPHSNTDHNINYSKSIPVPPPLPTSLSYGGDRTFTRAADSSSIQSSTSGYFTSSQETTRLTHSNDNYESSQQNCSFSNDHSSFRSRTLPGHIRGSRTSKFKFQRPRGAFSAHTESAAKHLASVSNPCLRESSV